MLRTYGGQHNCNDIYVKGALSLLSQKKTAEFFWMPKFLLNQNVRKNVKSVDILLRFDM